ncbi:MAG: hypothetical protein EHM87_21675 [Burkholderiales bacterium]|nr:MAG: hypothetical protein EHM87_21675 [Burkholderiales bacterium]
MRLADHRLLDALCGAYLLGTLRGAARRRFERALREEPRVAARVAHWRGGFATRPIEAASPAPTSAEVDRGWTRLQRELGLAPARAPWWGRTGFWQGWAAVATFAFGIAVWRAVPEPAPAPPSMRALVELVDAGKRPVLSARLSADGRLLELQPSRTVVAGPTQSYELWVIPAGGGAPLSVAVLGELGARIEVPPALRERLRPGATLAVSVEPAGGSPTGAPTGPVILSGAIGG